jgi:hypothetical protein
MEFFWYNSAWLASPFFGFRNGIVALRSKIKESGNPLIGDCALFWLAIQLLSGVRN